MDIVNDGKCKCCEEWGTTEIVQKMLREEELAEQRDMAKKQGMYKKNKKKELSTADRAND
jgi:hypothetical protein